MLIMTSLSASDAGASAGIGVGAGADFASIWGLHFFTLSVSEADKGALIQGFSLSGIYCESYLGIAEHYSELEEYITWQYVQSLFRSIALSDLTWFFSP